MPSVRYRITRTASALGYTLASGTLPTVSLDGGIFDGAEGEDQFGDCQAGFAPRNIIYRRCTPVLVRLGCRKQTPAHCVQSFGRLHLFNYSENSKSTRVFDKSGRYVEERWPNASR